MTSPASIFLLSTLVVAFTYDGYLRVHDHLRLHYHRLVGICFSWLMVAANAFALTVIVGDIQGRGNECLLSVALFIIAAPFTFYIAYLLTKYAHYRMEL